MDGKRQFMYLVIYDTGVGRRGRLKKKVIYDLFEDMLSTPKNVPSGNGTELESLRKEVVLA